MFTALNNFISYAHKSKFHSSVDALCAKRLIAWCQSGYVNSRSSHLETHAAGCLSSVTPNPTIPTALSSLPVSRRQRYTPAAACFRVSVNVCAWPMLCKHIHSQPFCKNLMNLWRTVTCQLPLVLSCRHCSFTLFATVVSQLSLFVCWKWLASLCLYLLWVRILHVLILYLH